MRVGRVRRCVLVIVVVVDPVFEADASFGFGSEPAVVRELVGEGAVDDPFGFAVGLGSGQSGSGVRVAEVKLPAIFVAESENRAARVVGYALALLLITL